jgi:2,4-didehydro-3-deoxy-L-rhamnonate hydrolase
MMHLCRFNNDRLGLVEGSVVFDVSEALRVLPVPTWPYPPGDPLILHLDEVRAAALQAKASAPRKPLDQVTLHSPITCPTKIMAAPANYRLHVEIDAQDPGVHHGKHHLEIAGVERPVEKFGLFLKANSAIVGPADGVALHWLDRRNDHEVELSVVIGRKGKNIPAARALEYVAGYMVGLDIVVRGTEDRSYRKSADSYAVFGPWLTTADEIADPQDLTFWLEVNGRPQQRSSSGAMTVKIDELIEIASRVYTLYPGDIIMTGSPEGVSALKPGDRLRAGCEKIGEMTLDVRAA